jgi:hypothetical protein
VSYEKAKQKLSEEAKSIAVSIVYSMTETPEFDVYKNITDPILLKDAYEEDKP